MDNALQTVRNQDSSLLRHDVMLLVE